MLLSACSWFSSSDPAQNTSQQSSSSSTAPTSQTGSEGSEGAGNVGSSTSSTGSGDATGSGTNHGLKSTGKTMSKELANELLESAKQGKLNDCEFTIGTKLQEVISKWGDPQAGDVSVAIYRSKRCSFYTDYSETTIPVAPAPTASDEESGSSNDEEGAENGTEDGTENANIESTDEQSEETRQLETPIEEEAIDDLSKLNIVAIVSSDAKYRNISVESVKQALGKPTKEQKRKLIYQAGSYTLEFPYNQNKLITSVVVAK